MRQIKTLSWQLCDQILPGLNLNQVIGKFGANNVPKFTPILEHLAIEGDGHFLILDQLYWFILAGYKNIQANVETTANNVTARLEYSHAGGDKFVVERGYWLIKREGFSPQVVDAGVFLGMGQAASLAVLVQPTKDGKQVDVCALVNSRGRPLQPGRWQLGILITADNCNPVRGTIELTVTADKKLDWVHQPLRYARQEEQQPSSFAERSGATSWALRTLDSAIGFLDNASRNGAVGIFVTAVLSLIVLATTADRQAGIYSGIVFFLIFLWLSRLKWLLSKTPRVRILALLAFACVCWLGALYVVKVVGLGVQKVKRSAEPPSALTSPTLQPSDPPRQPPAETPLPIREGPQKPITPPKPTVDFLAPQPHEHPQYARGREQFFGFGINIRSSQPLVLNDLHVDLTKVDGMNVQGGHLPQKLSVQEHGTYEAYVELFNVNLTRWAKDQNEDQPMLVQLTLPNPPGYMMWHELEMKTHTFSLLVTYGSQKFSRDVIAEHVPGRGPDYRLRLKGVR